MDFDNLLDQTSADVKPPARLPTGTYTWQILGRKFDKSTNKKTPYVEYTLKCMGHDDDVVDELPENWLNREMKETFYITDAALSRLTDFNKIVTKGGSEELSVRDGIELTSNGEQFVKGNIVHRPYTARNNEPAVAVEFGGLWAEA